MPSAGVTIFFNNVHKIKADWNETAEKEKLVIRHTGLGIVFAFILDKKYQI